MAKKEKFNKAKVSKIKMPSAGAWLTNAGKSVGYAAFDVLKEIMPATADTVSSASDTVRDIRDDLMSAKSQGTITDNIIMQNIYKGKTALGKATRDVLNDLKTGNLYKTAGSGMDDDFDFDMGDFDIGDDSDYDSSFESEDGSTKITTSKSSKDGTKEISNVNVKVDIGENSPMVQAVVNQTKAATDSAKAQLEFSKVNDANMIRSFTTLRTMLDGNLGSIDSNIASVATGISSIAQSSTVALKYYDDSMAVFNSINTNLTALKEYVTTPHTTQGYGEGEYTDALDMFTSNGALDIRSYLSTVKKQASSAVDNNMILSTIKSIFDNRDAIAGMSPVSMATQAVIKKLVPAVAKEAAESFDRTLSESAITFLYRLRGMGNSSDNPLLQFLGETFGIDNKYKGGIDKSKYNRGKVDWDGQSHKTLNEVIPYYLRQIASAVSGKEEKAFDYERGVFRDLSEIVDEFKQRDKYITLDGLSTVTDDFKDYLDNINVQFANTNIEETVNKSMENFLTKLVKNNYGGMMKLTDTGDGTMSFLDSVSKVLGTSTDDEAAKLIASFFDTNDRSYTMSTFGRKILEARANATRARQDIEQNQAASNYMYVDNGTTSKAGNPINYKKSPFVETDSYGKTPIYYMKNIYRLLAEGIRVYPETNTGINGGEPTTPRHYSKVLSEFGLMEGAKKAKEARDAASQSVAMSSEEMADVKESGGFVVGGKGSTSLKALTAAGKAYQAEVRQDAIDNAKNSSSIFNKITGLGSDTVLSKIVNSTIDAVNKPSKLLAGVFDYLDNKLFSIVFGGKTGPRGSIVTTAMDFMKDKFSEFSFWLNDKVLTPVYNAIFGDEGLINQIKQSELGQSVKEGFNKVKEYIIGKEDENGNLVGGMFSEFSNDLKGIVSNIKERVLGDGPDSYLSGAKLRFSQMFDGMFRMMGFDPDEARKRRAETGKGPVTQALDDVRALVKGRFKAWTDAMLGPEADPNALSTQFARGLKKDMGGMDTSKIGSGAMFGLLTSIFLPGGPMFHMILGAGKSFVKQSETMQTLLFGDKDENGERKGRFISKELIDLYQENKSGLKIGLGAGVLSAIGILPGLAGGSLTYALAGGAASLVYNLDSVQEMLFGPKDKDGNRVGGGFVDRFKKAIGGMDQNKHGLKTTGIDAGVGAGIGIVGSLFLPGGPLLWGLAGAVSGIVASTDKFKDYMFGAMDEESGHRKGGKLPELYNQMMGPVKNAIYATQIKAVNWVEERVITPMTTAIAPMLASVNYLIEDIKLGVARTVEFVKGKLHDMVLKPAGKATKMIFAPLVKAVKTVTSGFLRIIGRIITSPFTLMKYAGYGLNALHRRRGRKDFTRNTIKNALTFNKDKRKKLRFTEEQDKVLNRMVSFFKYFSPKARKNSRYGDEGAWYNRTGTTSRKEQKTKIQESRAWRNYRLKQYKKDHEKRFSNEDRAAFDAKHGYNQWWKRDAKVVKERAARAKIEEAKRLEAEKKLKEAKIETAKSTINTKDVTLNFTGKIKNALGLGGKTNNTEVVPKTGTYLLSKGEKVIPTKKPSESIKDEVNYTKNKVNANNYKQHLAANGVKGAMALGGTAASAGAYLLSAGEKVVKKANKIGAYAKQDFAPFTNAAVSAGTGAKNKIHGIVSPVTDPVFNTVGNIKNRAVRIATSGGDLRPEFRLLKKGIRKGYRNLNTGIGNIARPILTTAQGIKNGVSNAASSIGNFISPVTDPFMNFGKHVAGEIAPTFAPLVNKVKSAATGVGQAISPTYWKVSNAIGRTRDNLNSTLADGVRKVTGFNGNFKPLIRQGKNLAANAGSTIASGIQALPGMIAANPAMFAGILGAAGGAALLGVGAKKLLAKRKAKKLAKQGIQPSQIKGRKALGGIIDKTGAYILSKGETVLPAIGTNLNKAKALEEAAYQKIKSGASSAGNVISGQLNGAGSTIGSKLNTAKNYIFGNGTTNASFDPTKGMVMNHSGNLKYDALNTFNKAKDTIGGQLNGVGNVIGSKLNTAKNYIFGNGTTNASFDPTKGMVMNHSGNLKYDALNTFNKAKDTISGGLTGAGSTIGGKINSVKNALNTGFDNAWNSAGLTEKFNGLGSKVASAVTSLPILSGVDPGVLKLAGLGGLMAAGTAAAISTKISDIKFGLQSAKSLFGRRKAKKLAKQGIQPSQIQGRKAAGGRINRSGAYILSKGEQVVPVSGKGVAKVVVKLDGFGSGKMADLNGKQGKITNQQADFMKKQVEQMGQMLDLQKLIRSDIDADKAYKLEQKRQKKARKGKTKAKSAKAQMKEQEQLRKAQEKGRYETIKRMQEEQRAKQKMYDSINSIKDNTYIMINQEEEGQFNWKQIFGKKKGLLFLSLFAAVPAILNVVRNYKKIFGNFGEKIDSLKERVSTAVDQVGGISGMFARMKDSVKNIVEWLKNPEARKESLTNFVDNIKNNKKQLTTYADEQYSKFSTGAFKTMEGIKQNTLGISDTDAYNHQLGHKAEKVGKRAELKLLGAVAKKVTSGTKTKLKFGFKPGGKGFGFYTTKVQKAGDPIVQNTLGQFIEEAKGVASKGATKAKDGYAKVAGLVDDITGKTALEGVLMPKEQFMQQMMAANPELTEKNVSKIYKDYVKNAAKSGIKPTNVGTGGYKSKLANKFSAFKDGIKEFGTTTEGRLLKDNTSKVKSKLASLKDDVVEMTGRKAKLASQSNLTAQLDLVKVGDNVNVTKAFQQYQADWIANEAKYAEQGMTKMSVGEFKSLFDAKVSNKSLQELEETAYKYAAKAQKKLGPKGMLTQEEFYLKYASSFKSDKDLLKQWTKYCRSNGVTTTSDDILKNLIKQNASESVDDVIGKISTAAGKDAAKTAKGNTITKIKDGLRNSKIGNKITGLTDDIAAKGGTKAAIKDTVKGAKNKIVEAGSKFTDDIAEKGLKTTVKDTTKSGLSKVGSVVKKGLSVGGNTAGKAANYLKQMFTHLANAIKWVGKKLGISSIDDIIKNITTKFTKLTKNAKFMKEFSKKCATGFVRNAKAMLKGINIIFGVTGGISGAYNASNLFAVDNDAVDYKMRTISAMWGSLKNVSLIAAVVDLVNEVMYSTLGINFIREVSVMIYNFVSTPEETGDLQQSMKDFEEEYNNAVAKEYQEYLKSDEGKQDLVTEKDETGKTITRQKTLEEFKKSGKATTFAEYNNAKHQTLGTKVKTAVTKVKDSVVKKAAEIYSYKDKSLGQAFGKEYWNVDKYDEDGELKSQFQLMKEKGLKVLYLPIQAIKFVIGKAIGVMEPIITMFKNFVGNFVSNLKTSTSTMWSKGIAGVFTSEYWTPPKEEKGEVGTLNTISFYAYRTLMFVPDVILGVIGTAKIALGKIINGLLYLGGTIAEDSQTGLGAVSSVTDVFSAKYWTVPEGSGEFGTLRKIIFYINRTLLFIPATFVGLFRSAASALEPIITPIRNAIDAVKGKMDLDDDGTPDIKQDTLGGANKVFFYTKKILAFPFMIIKKVFTGIGTVASKVFKGFMSVASELGAVALDIFEKNPFSKEFWTFKDTTKDETAGPLHKVLFYAAKVVTLPMSLVIQLVKTIGGAIKPFISKIGNAVKDMGKDIGGAIENRDKLFTREYWVLHVEDENELSPMRIAIFTGCRLLMFPVLAVVNLVQHVIKNIGPITESIKKTVSLIGSDFKDAFSTVTKEPSITFSDKYWTMSGGDDDDKGLGPVRKVVFYGTRLLGFIPLTVVGLVSNVYKAIKPVIDGIKDAIAAASKSADTSKEGKDIGDSLSTKDAPKEKKAGSFDVSQIIYYGKKALMFIFGAVSAVVKGVAAVLKPIFIVLGKITGAILSDVTTMATSAISKGTLSKEYWTYTDNSDYGAFTPLRKIMFYVGRVMYFPHMTIVSVISSLFVKTNKTIDTLKKIGSAIKDDITSGYENVLDPKNILGTLSPSYWTMSGENSLEGFGPLRAILFYTGRVLLFPSLTIINALKNVGNVLIKIGKAAFAVGKAIVTDVADTAKMALNSDDLVTFVTNYLKLPDKSVDDNWGPLRAILFYAVRILAFPNALTIKVVNIVLNKVVKPLISDVMKVALCIKDDTITGLKTVVNPTNLLGPLSPSYWKMTGKEEKRGLGPLRTVLFYTGRVLLFPAMTAIKLVENVGLAILGTLYMAAKVAGFIVEDVVTGIPIGFNKGPFSSDYWTMTSAQTEDGFGPLRTVIFYTTRLLMAPAMLELHAIKKVFDGAMFLFDGFKNVVTAIGSDIIDAVVDMDATDIFTKDYWTPSTIKSGGGFEILYDILFYSSRVMLMPTMLVKSVIKTVVDTISGTIDFFKNLPDVATKTANIKNATLWNYLDPSAAGIANKTGFEGILNSVLFYGVRLLMFPAKVMELTFQTAYDCLPGWLQDILDEGKRGWDEMTNLENWTDGSIPEAFGMWMDDLTSGFGDEVTKRRSAKSRFGGYGDDLPDNQNGFAYYSQNDPSIKNKPYSLSSGGKSNRPETMGSRGCGPTAMAMVASSLKGGYGSNPYSPSNMARIAEEENYSTNIGTTPAYFTQVGQQLGMNVTPSSPNSRVLESMLNNGEPVIMQGSSIGLNGSPYTKSGHYVVAVGMNPDGTVNVNDPRGKKYSKSYTMDQMIDGSGMMWGYSNGDAGYGSDTNIIPIKRKDAIKKGGDLKKKFKFGGYGPETLIGIDYNPSTKSYSTKSTSSKKTDKTTQNKTSIPSLTDNINNKNKSSNKFVSFQDKINNKNKSSNKFVSFQDKINQTNKYNKFIDNINKSGSQASANGANADSNVYMYTVSNSANSDISKLYADTKRTSNELLRKSLSNTVNVLTGDKSGRKFDKQYEMTRSYFTNLNAALQQYVDNVKASKIDGSNTIYIDKNTYNALKTLSTSKSDFSKDWKSLIEGGGFSPVSKTKYDKIKSQTEYIKNRVTAFNQYMNAWGSSTDKTSKKYYIDRMRGVKKELRKYYKGLLDPGIPRDADKKLLLPGKLATNMRSANIAKEYQEYLDNKARLERMIGIYQSDFYRATTISDKNRIAKKIAATTNKLLKLNKEQGILTGSEYATYAEKLAKLRAKLKKEKDPNKKFAIKDKILKLEQSIVSKVNSVNKTKQLVGSYTDVNTLKTNIAIWQSQYYQAHTNEEKNEILEKIKAAKKQLAALLGVDEKSVNVSVPNKGKKLKASDVSITVDGEDISTVTGDSGTGDGSWMMAVKAVKSAIAAAHPEYDRTGNVRVDLNIGGNTYKMRPDCSGYVSCCLQVVGRLNSGTILSSNNFNNKSDSTMLGTGFTAMDWPGWEGLQEGDIIATSGHVEIFSHIEGSSHKVYNCGSTNAIKVDGVTGSAHSEYTTVWRPGSDISGSATGTMSSSSTVSENNGNGSLASKLAALASAMATPVKEYFFGSSSSSSSSSGSSDSSGSTSVASVDISGSSYPEKVWNYFTGKGYSKEATAGILGNMQQESGVDPTKIQSGGKGPAAGIVQWENYNKKSERWKSMYDYATKRGYKWTDLEPQLMFVDEELRNLGKFWNYKPNMDKAGTTGTTFEKWKASTDIDTATRQFEGAFERAGTIAMDNRLSAAKQYYDKFAGGGNGGFGGFGDDSSSSSYSKPSRIGGFGKSKSRRSKLADIISRSKSNKSGVYGVHNKSKSRTPIMGGFGSGQSNPSVLYGGYGNSTTNPAGVYGGTSDNDTGYTVAEYNVPEYKPSKQTSTNKPNRTYKQTQGGGFGSSNSAMLKEVISKVQKQEGNGKKIDDQTIDILMQMLTEMKGTNEGINKFNNKELTVKTPVIVSDTTNNNVISSNGTDKKVSKSSKTNNSSFVDQRSYQLAKRLASGKSYA